MYQSVRRQLGHGVWDWRRGGYGGTTIPGWTADKTNPHGRNPLMKYPGKKSKAEAKELVTGGT